eukprot:1161207-Pelagomonas_calceolata.AAC.5
MALDDICNCTHRFQPMDERCDMALDDIEPASWKKLLAAAEEFCVAHSAALDDLAAALLEGAPPLVDRCIGVVGVQVLM